MAGTVTIEKQSHGNTDFNRQPVTKWTFAWESDASGDADLNTQEAKLGFVSGTIERVVFIPDGTDAPTTLYDVKINDEDGLDVLGGQGADLSATVANQVQPGIPLTDGTTTSVAPVTVNNILDLVVSNAGNAKKGTVVLYLR